MANMKFDIGAVMRAILFFMALLMACFVAQAQKTTPNPSQHIEQKQHISSRSSSNDQRGIENNPLIVEVHPDQIPEPIAIKTVEHEKDYFSPEWWLVYVTVPLVIVTAILALFTYKLWSATKDLAADAKETATNQANKTDESIKIAKKSADAAKLTAEALLGVQLPRFVVAKIEWQNVNESLSKKLNDGTIVVTLVNHGNTEALITSHSLEIIVDAELPLKPEYPKSSVRIIDFGKVIQKDSIHEMSFRLGHLSDMQIEHIRSKKIKLWVYGYIAYRDFFDKAHKSGFVAVLESFRSYLSGGDPTDLPESNRWLQERPTSYTYSVYDISDYTSVTTNDNQQV
jgi:hypothetical protein